MVRADTSACNFTTRPIYITSLVGENLLYISTGGSTPYVLEATARTQFDIYVTGSTPTNANSNKWHIEWIGIGN